MANMDKIKDKLSILPEKPGCYLMRNVRNEIIYVGKAKKLKQRVSSYFTGVHDYKTTKLVSNIDDFEFIVTTSEKEALLLEINLIKKYTPPYNIMFMDDKTYPYLKLTGDQAPILKVVRNTKDKKATYFGPYPDSGAAYQTMKLLNQLYPLRKCRVLPKRLCLYYHIGQCLGPCVFTIDPSVYVEMRKSIQRFLQGDTKEILDELRKEMNEASLTMQYEKAKDKLDLIQAIEHVTEEQQIDFKDRRDRDIFAYYADKGFISIQGFFIRGGKMIERTFSMKPLYEEASDAFQSFVLQYYEKNPFPQELLLPNTEIDKMFEEVLNTKIVYPIRGNKKKLMDMVTKNAQTAHAQQFELVERKENRREEAMEQLSTLLKKEVHRIELFDNSHISGSFNVSGMVVYKDGVPSKKDYRLFRLEKYRSDLDSMKEAVYRRYFRLLKEGTPFPDVLIVDGGKQQIEAAKEVLDALYIQSITLIGLVKNEKHRTSNLMNSDLEILPVERDSSLFFLLTQMQDEVHRFAISYHKRLRNKAMTKSVLDEVEGLGEVRKKDIWREFKTLKNLKDASIETIAKVIPMKSAVDLYDLLHQDQSEDIE